MSKSNNQVRQLISLAKEAKKYSGSEYELLSSALLVAGASKKSRTKYQPRTKYHSEQTASIDASFQSKLQVSYGL